MPILRVGGRAMVVEDHFINDMNYKNRHGRVIMITRKVCVIDFPDVDKFQSVPINKVVGYKPEDVA